MNLLERFIFLYNRLPLFLQDSIRPYALKLHDRLANRAYLNNQHDEGIKIPLGNPKENKYIDYKHSYLTPRYEKQFRNNFFPNDYSEIETETSLWRGKPVLKASIVVASYNQRETLEINLSAWSHQTYPLELIEVIVADDGSSDGTQELVEVLSQKVPYKLKFYTHEDDGFRLAKVRNEGVALSEGEIVFFVDADTIPSPEYIWEHMKYYHVSDCVSVVGMRHRINLKGISGFRIDRENIDLLRQLPMEDEPDATEEVKRWRKNILFNNKEFRKEPNVWGGFHGTLTSCRKRDYIGVGGNDESFNVYGQEDSEFGFRLLSKVQYLISNPKARLYHIEHPSNPQVLDPRNKEVLRQKTKGPKVTVYIAVYNGEEFIDRAVNSFLDQTFHDAELIIVDYGSTDSTSSILDNYRYHPKIRLYRQPNKGKAAASNLALLYSRGKYICPLGQNDTLMPEAIDILSTALDQDKRLGIIYSGYNIVTNDEEVQVNTQKEYKPGSFLINEVRKPMMWKKDCFDITVGFNEEVSEYAEYDIALKLEEVSLAKHIDAIVYNSFSTTSTQSTLSDTDIMIEKRLVLENTLKRRNIKLIPQLSKNEVAFLTQS